MPSEWLLNKKFLSLYASVYQANSSIPPTGSTVLWSKVSKKLKRYNIIKLLCVVRLKFFWFENFETSFMAQRKSEFHHVLWAGSSHILLVLGHSLLILVNDFVGGKLAWPLNPLSPKSDQHQISPCSISAL